MPWRHCAGCDVKWLGYDPCWHCKQPGSIATPPRVKTYAEIIVAGVPAAPLP